MENLKLIGLLCIFGFCSNVFAWGKIGHRITGEIAEIYLTEKTRSSIQTLLGHKVSKEAVGLASMSNHADFIKSDPKMRKRYNHWHYLSFDNGDDIKQYIKKNPKAENIIFAIKHFSNILKNNKNKAEERIFALKLLVHFVGDIHQPLHLGKESDRGGNKISVKWFNEKTNLHSIWDEKIIQSQELSYTEYANELKNISASDLKKWQEGDLFAWAQESKDYVPKLYDTGKGKYWEYNYTYTHLAFMNQRLQMGGVRLAQLLNQIFM